MRLLFILLRKDLQLELRSKETIVLFFGNIVALSAIVASGLASAFVEPPVVSKLFPTLLWTIFFFAAALSSARAYEQEMEMRAFEGVVMGGGADWKIYASKVVSSGLILFTGFLFSIVVLGVLTDLPAWNHIYEPGILGFLVTFGYNSLSCLLVAISSSSRLRGVLLPLLLLPLIFPIFFAAIEVTFAILTEGGFPWTSPWVSLLMCVDLVFLVLGINLYRFVLYE